jgi:regulator of nucleoside diphosphate kinase
MEKAMMTLHEVSLSRTDAEALAQMLEVHRRGPAESDPAEALAELLSHASRVPDGELPADRIAMGSTVTYVEEPSGLRRTVTLAYPAEADLRLGKISVLSPIGRALIGRKRGETVDAELPGGRWLEVRVVATEQGREPLRKAA